MAALAADGAQNARKRQEMMVTPSDPRFHFPYAVPYSIQVDLQRHLYSALAQSRVTVVESPTGTVSHPDSSSMKASSSIADSSPPAAAQGKSLSLLCASLTFLSDLRAHTRAALLRETRARVEKSFGGSDEPEWVLEQECERVLAELKRGEDELEARLEDVRRREAEERARAGSAVANKRAVSAPCGGPLSSVSQG